MYKLPILTYGRVLTLSTKKCHKKSKCLNHMLFFLSPEKTYNMYEHFPFFPPRDFMMHFHIRKVGVYVLLKCFVFQKFCLNLLEYIKFQFWETYSFFSS